ncbi:RCC1 and BTB domain-containing protein 1 [Dermatophagoides farinae]|uniref:RCC1 and BTB domain-containing protein 1 n=1 Tax=Dermatophagoides farinae TaxID=6954 RepID=A0A922IH83_DERFA|nr:RCC1 and BTB domain-containing protein 1 [Dermatophagoides farinae]
MARLPTENIDIIDLFQDDFKYIDQEYLPSIVSICSLYICDDKKEFILMTIDATWAYGKQICSLLSLEHDMSKPQRISVLNGVKIVQVDYGITFVAILTDQGQVFLASEWKTNKTLQLINTGNDCFKMIACGQFHLLLLRQDGHVFAMGDNSYGQKTGNEKSSLESMIHIDNLENVQLIDLVMEKTETLPCLVPFPNDNSTRIKDIVAGMYHSLFLFENGQLWGCGSSNMVKLVLLTKVPIENVQQIVCSKFHNFSLVYDGSSYYAWGKNGHWSSPKKLDYHPTSFASASTMILSSPITFGLTSTIHVFGSHDPISYQSKSILQLFDNQDNCDVEFIIDKKHIKACKCYLKSVSEYYRLMFSGNWIKKDQVPIQNYSYETYYAYLRMLHTGDLNEQTMTTYLPLITKYEMKELHDKLIHLTIKQMLPKCFRSSIMANSHTDNIDIELFKDDLEYIDQDFLQSIIQIFCFNYEDEKQFLLMTEEATYAYVDSVHEFVAILTEDGQVFLASDVKLRMENE